MSVKTVNSRDLTSSDEAHSFVAALIHNCHPDEPIDANTVLKNHPELWNYRTIVLDLVYEEFQQRRLAGESVNPDSFAENFPEIRKSLICYISVLNYLENNISSLNDSSSSWPKIGEEFLGFELIEELGRGSFSKVYLASDTALADRKVVVKVCHRGSEESSLIGKLDHPNIVPVFSSRYENASGLTAICMPFTTRITLLNVLDDVFSNGRNSEHSQPLFAPTSRSSSDISTARVPGFSNAHKNQYSDSVIKIGLQVTSALEYAHGRGIYHCDIKPSNILIHSNLHAQLFDFNLSLLNLEEANQNNLGGTLPYMSPEQLMCLLNSPQIQSVSINGKTDIFSLGATLYELLTGELPFGPISHEATPKEILETQLAQRQHGPNPMLEIDNSLNNQLVRLIERCLSFDPDDRIESAEELHRQLKKFLSKNQQLIRYANDHRKTTLAVSASLLLGVGYLGNWIITRDPYAIRELNSGRLLFQDQKYSESIESCNNVLAIDDHDVDALFLRGRAFFQNGQIEKAYTDFLAADELIDDGRVTACIAHCVSLLNEDYNGALSLYHEAQNQGFESAAMHNNIGLCYLQTGDHTRAAESCKFALGNNDKFPATYEILAAVEFHLAVTKHQFPNQWQFETAFDLGLSTPRLYEIAALCYSASLKYGLNTVAQQESLDKLFKTCSKAVQQGINAASLLRKVKSSLPDAMAVEDLRTVLSNSMQNARPVPIRKPLLDPLMGEIAKTSLASH